MVHSFLNIYTGCERHLENLVKGLTRLGHEVTVASIYVSRDNLERFKGHCNVLYSKLSDMPLEKTRYATIADILINFLSRKFYNLFKKNSKLLKDCDLALLTHESGFGAMLKARRKGIFSAIGWWCVGTPHLYSFLKPVRMQFGRFTNILLDGVSMLSPHLIREFWSVGNFDLLFTNCKWLANLLTYMVGCRVNDVIYPPVDVEEFKPTPSKTSMGKYVLVVGGRRDIDFSEVKQIAKTIKVVKCGSEPIEGCVNLGYVPNDKLVELYSNAYFTLYPTLLEQFGYIPAESMSCGTPVLTYNWQGPGEIVTDGETGWLVNTPPELYRKAADIWENGYDKKLRSNCRKHCLENFEVKASAKRLVEAFNSYVRR